MTMSNFPKFCELHSASLKIDRFPETCGAPSKGVHVCNLIIDVWHINLNVFLLIISKMKLFLHFYLI